MATTVGPISLAPGLPSGIRAVLNITAATVVKDSAGILVTLCVATPGTSGTLTLNDAATVGTASAVNAIQSFPYNGSNFFAGAVIRLDWPCGTGIVISAIPAGAVVAVAYS